MVIDESMVARIAALGPVQDAAEAGAALVSLWPLTDSTRMDNDAKYAENLQVRITREIAMLLTGETVTMPDAEFVYEGADEIPGRPQSLVDALIAANDAYDAMGGLAHDGDASVLDDAAQSLGVPWNASVSQAVDGIVHAVEHAADAVQHATVPDAADVAAFAQRFALSIIAADALIAAADADSHAVDARRVRSLLPALLAINEINERIAMPRVFMTVDQTRKLLDVWFAAQPSAQTAESGDDVTFLRLEALATLTAPLAADEWRKHRDDVLWDPDEAKRLAKEEDERRNKEALAAKFAHVPTNDAGKEHVEL
ncbi:hypothetical protein [Bifidobacterium jacchi]|uniref:Uncharacterized protein n=1 Tax=Bifidobacterium jacchi TaxID=2490545 RepID=A0A5N5RFH2_9BIFI|nr:hypothetical protein [Bifidobacterium jacchi]KAB5606032.1 hypothetical protein EHS19_08145 [Bifidobacterium jacchi]